MAQHSGNIVRHDGIINGGGVGSSPASGAMVPKAGFRGDVKVSSQVLDTLVKVTHDHITLRKRHMLANDVVNTLGSTSQIAAMAIDGSDLNLTNMLHLNADRDVLVSGFSGMGKGGNSKTFGPNEAHSTAGVAINGGVGKAKIPLQPERLKLSLGLVNSGLGVKFMLLKRKNGKLPELLVVQGSNPGAPAGDVSGHKKQLFAPLPFSMKTLGGIPNPQIAHNVNELFCRTRSSLLVALRLSIGRAVSAPNALRRKIQLHMKDRENMDMHVSVITILVPIALGRQYGELPLQQRKALLGVGLPIAYQPHCFVAQASPQFWVL